ncbi:hypothetical protein FBU30_001516 [Linnemannia zychae]|nr:hypothetical protein FBU30_001516 [Linnemannia zychae]
MRFHSIIASALVFVTLAAAQSPPANPADTTACETCIVHSAMATSAGCGDLLNMGQPSDSTGQYTDAEKKCFCALASSQTWLNDCAKADVCGSELIQSIIQSYAAIRPHVCSGRGISTTGNSASSCTNSKVTVVGLTAATVAALGALM